MFTFQVDLGQVLLGITMATVGLLVKRELARFDARLERFDFRLDRHDQILQKLIGDTQRLIGIVGLRSYHLKSEDNDGE